MTKSTAKRTVILAILIFSLFVCSVGVAAADKNEYVQKGFNEAQKYYQNYSDKMTLKGYWAVYGAYATLGERIQNGKYVYDMSADDVNHNGAKILAIMMMGGDPYHYNGVNYVEKAAEKGLNGGYAVPVFNFLGLQAAGAEMTDAQEKGYIDYCCNQIAGEPLTSLGPDVGGWAIAALYDYFDHPVYKDQIAKAIKTYTDSTGENMAGATMGSSLISTGCVVVGLTSLCAAGWDGVDPTTDQPWIGQKPMEIMYRGLTEGEANVSSAFNHQYYMEFSDLYRVLYNGDEQGWIKCKLDAADLTALISEAENFLKTSNDAAKVKATEKALAAVKALSAEERNASRPQWGELYFDLQYAMINGDNGNSGVKGDPSVFTDIDQKAWYAPHVNAVIEAGLMNGTSATTFVPNDKLTRAMVVQILYKMEGMPGYNANNNPFFDVKAKDWFAPAVLWAYQNKITSGTSATTFDPNEKVTREQMATFIYRYMGESFNGGNVSKFKDDAQISDYAKDAVYSMASEGIINGVGGGKFAPKDTASRAQMATIIDKAFLK